MMKNTDNDKLLANKRRIDAERRERAIARARQETLRRITPGVATPGTLRDEDWARRQRNAGNA